MPDTRDSDIVLAPNEYAYIYDQNSGQIQPSVGPTKRTLENTERTVLFDSRTGQFKEVPPSQAKQLFTKANETSYIVLENPATPGAGVQEHPVRGRSNPMPDLQWGKKQIIQGPVTFPLWPGQVATVLDGHRLRSNQYLVCVVDNAKEAATNKAVVDKVVDTVEPTAEPKAIADNAAAEPEQKKEKGLKTGEILIIKGTEISYYIPPTGISVLPEDGCYVREAVTLERLQYSILRDENGNKRYEKGPAVVFPEPTETFIVVNGSRVFDAIELNEQMGLYIKVTADYKEDKEYKAGDELFITGKDLKIYYPRPEHSIIKYGDKTRHYSIAIPKGEARYILDKESGEIKTVKGPTMYLPDPRKEVVVRRILNEKQVVLWYPDNTEALTYNRDLAIKSQGEKYVKDENAASSGENYLRSDSDDTLRSLSMTRMKGARYAATPGRDIQNMYGDSQVIGERMDRGVSYSPPRTITLNTKYEGAVLINVWPGFAVQIVSKTGEREVVVGPKSAILDYDQTLEMLSLSTGKPKSDEKLLETVYLQVKNNRVSDIVDSTTKDMVNISARVNYRLHFEGDPKLWFSVDNYVKFLTQNLRSIIRNEIKKHTIQDVSDNIASIIRDLILGKTSEKQSERPGRKFEENGMHVIDVEILSLEIGDDRIRSQLQGAQYQAIENTLKVSLSKQNLEASKTIESDLQESLALKLKTDTEKLGNQKKIIELQRLNDQTDLFEQKKMAETRDQIAEIQLARTKKEADQTLDELTKKSEITVGAFERQMGAIEPKVIEAMIATSNKELAGKFVENIPKAGNGVGMFLGSQLIENLCSLVKGSPLESALRNIGDTKTAK